MHTAWGGITLGDKGWGMMQLYPYTFSSGGGGSEYARWDFSAFEADAVVINLGTNDRPAPNDTKWSDACGVPVFYFVRRPLTRCSDTPPLQLTLSPNITRVPPSCFFSHMVL